MVQRLVLDYRKLSLMVLLGVTFYNEYWSYYSSYLQWPSTPQKSDGTKVSVLLIADPQIQGLTDEPDGLFGSVTRWDSDRYLSKTFSYALAYQPDVILFLGDLIDEGSVAKDDDTYAGYVKRFDGIYPRNSAKNMIYVPGDNDIGGEGADPVTEEKLQRYTKFFSTPRQVSITERLDIVSVSRLFPSNITSFEDKPHPNFRIVMSHIPIMPLPSEFSLKVLKHVKPSVIFSAHNHQGMSISGDRNTGRAPGDVAPTFFSKKSDSPVTVHLLTSDDSEDFLTEIAVPTCSYRMGVKEMAIGLAVVDISSATLTYYNMWLPSRFALLYLYVAALISSGILFLLGRMRAVRKPRSRRSSSQYAKLV